MTAQIQPQRLRIGEGKISGYLSIFLAVISLAAVICFHFPEYFTTPAFRAVYPLKVLLWVLLACLVLAFAFALTTVAAAAAARPGINRPASARHHARRPRNSSSSLLRSFSSARVSRLRTVPAGSPKRRAISLGAKPSK